MRFSDVKHRRLKTHLFVNEGGEALPKSNPTTWIYSLDQMPKLYMAKYSPPSIPEATLSTLIFSALVTLVLSVL